MLTFKETKLHLQVFWKGEELPLDYLCQHGCRDIFFHKNFIVKVDRPLTTIRRDWWALRQTAREIEFWETLQEDKEHFGKLLDYGRTPSGRYWLRQKRYRPEPESKCTPQILKSLDNLIFKYDLKDISIEWANGDGNWMIWKGEALIYDFGGYGS